MGKLGKLIAILVALCLALSGCASGASSTSTQEGSGSSEVPRLQDDFYTAINADWLNSTTIPEDQPAVSVFSEIQDSIDDLLRNDLDSMLTLGAPGDDALMQAAVEYYRLALDYETRDALGMDPLLPMLQRIEAYESLEQLSADVPELILDGYTLPFALRVKGDSLDSNINSLYGGEADLLLGSRSLYEESKDMGDVQLQYMEEYLLTLFELAGYNEQQAKSHWDAAVAFDASLVPLVLTDVEGYDVSQTTNITEFSEFAALSSSFNMQETVSALCGHAPEQITIDNPRYFAALDTVVNNNTFEQLKSWMLVMMLVGTSELLSEEAREAAALLDMKMYGIEEMSSPEDAAFDLVSSAFEEPIGKYYAQTYFGEEARAEVIDMVEDVIAVYRERLEANDWLGAETKEHALEKLDALTINVGWPEKLSPAFDSLRIVPAEEGGSLLSNTFASARNSLEYNYAQLDASVDKSLWGFGAQKVNAFYSPDNNGIYIPASILNEPFYSTEQADSKNYGGIGVVIGHEITHAFDASGALYDKEGNLNNWWSDEDFAEFDKRTQKMVDLFDGLPFASITINGELTKTENVADAGGVSCALQITQNLEDANLEEFFENYARIWRNLATEEYDSNKFLTDVHSPGIYRVNIQLSNCPTFCEVYGIQESDGMYIPADDQVAIW